MQKADTYATWRTLAEKYDQIPNVEARVNEVYSPYYDY